MRNRFKIILSLIFIIILVLLILLLSLSFKSEDNTPEYKTLDKINSYGYTLQDRDTKLMKEVFDKLKNTLNEDEVNYSLYAEYLSELFIIDLFTLNNKDNKYDVGSLEYVYEENLENYKLNVEDTLYKYIVDINSEDRGELPIVSNIEKVSLEEIDYTYNDVYDAYKVKLSWDYEKDLGYPILGEVTLIKKDNKLYVVSFKGVEE